MAGGGVLEDTGYIVFPFCKHRYEVQVKLKCSSGTQCALCMSDMHVQRMQWRMIIAAVQLHTIDAPKLDLSVVSTRHNE